MNPAVTWGLIAAVPAVLAEYLYRVTPGSWLSHWYMYVPLQLTISYSVFQLVRSPNTTLLDAFVVWAFSTTIMRVIVSVVVLHESVKGGTWFALGLLIMARIAQTFWGR